MRGWYVGWSAVTSSDQAWASSASGALHAGTSARRAKQVLLKLLIGDADQ
jgi:hypothetical protein